MASKVRPRPGGSWADVIDLDSYRTGQRQGKKPDVLLVQGEGNWTRHLGRLNEVALHRVTDPLRLRAVSMTRGPAVALIDGNLGWADPATIIHELHQRFGIPTILVMDEAPSPEWIRGAFAAGLHDLLIQPHGPEEIRECLELVCKIGQVAEG